MSRVLVVAEPARAFGEFRRPWVRALYRASRRLEQRALETVVTRLGAEHEVTLLVSRGGVDEARLGGAAALRFHDEESYQGDARLSRLSHDLVAAWWPPRGEEPGLDVGGVWLPDLLSMTKAVLLYLEVVEYAGMLERLLDEVKPERVVLMSGASIAERVACVLAAERGLEVGRARRALPTFARTARLLRRREERRALRVPLAQPRRHPLPAASRTIVFGVAHPRHFQLVEPLAQALAGRGVTPVVLAAANDPGAVEAPLRRLAGLGMAGAFIVDHLPPADARRLVRELRPLQRRLLARLSDTTAPGTLGAVVAPYARDTLTWTLATARLYLEAADRALDAYRPAAVVITSDRRISDRALALAARVRGIPVIVFWAGAILGRDRLNRFDVGDRILVIGEQVRTQLIEQGVEARRLAAVGDPRSNAARLVPAERLRAEVLSDFGLAPDRPLLVLVSKYVSVFFSGDEKAALYRTVRDALPRLGPVNVVVKVHPNEDLGLLRAQVIDWGWPDAVLTQDYDIHRLFGAATAAIMVTSMAGIEAMAMGCPVVAVQTPGKDVEGLNMLPYARAGAVERIEMGDAAGLATALRRLIDDPAERAALVERGRTFSERYVHPVDGALGDRLLAVVDEIRAELAAGGTR